MSLRDRNQLLRDLKAAFPQLTAELNMQRGQLHFEVEVFRRFAQHAILDGDRELTAHCYSLAAKYLIEGNGAVRDAIDVSFVEPLDFGAPPNQRSWAWQSLPGVLRNAYVAFHRKSGV
jgi:hypothetical protein